ncbi:D-alanyl-D-alanine carboxypeptidase/D-alanyl-D-alanine endopeptidase [Amycolatopsis panacis]|nr:D-alanyl-D-alanine carboxypeptidase/D-alanyl-D-alanine-endopeptidase [Amycolatopsis panacis]
MPDNDQPRWPTGDEDATPHGEGATGGLPLPKRTAGTTERLAVPNVTPGDGPGSWFRPNVPATPIPGLNAPAEPGTPDESVPPGEQTRQIRPSVQQPFQWQPESRADRPEPPGEQTRQVQWQPESRAEQPSVPWVPVERPQQPPRGTAPLFQPGRPDSGQEGSTQQFSAFHDESPGAGSAADGGQGWAAFRPVSPGTPQQPDAGEGWGAFRSESSAEGADPPSDGQPRSPEPTDAASRSGDGQPRWAAQEAVSWPGEGQPETPGSPGPRWDALQANQPGDGQPRGTEQGRDESWSQRIDVPIRPEPGDVPSASSGPARPMRIEPSRGQFASEATVGIPRLQQAEAAQPAGAEPEAQPADGIPEQLASESTVGLRPPPPETPPAPPAGGDAPKRGRKKLVIAGIVVVLLLAAAGGASAVPQVATRLGLPWAPNAPKGAAPDPADVSLSLHGPDTSGPGATANGVASALSGPAGAPALAKLSGSVIDPATGTALWDRDSATALTPASTTKILTVAAALLAMDPGERLTTKIVQGAQPGTVILVGGGDPTLTTLPQGTDSPLYPGAAHVDDLITQVKKAGGNVSKVQVDVSAYTGPPTAQGWEPGDAPSTYGAPIAPVMTDGGRGNAKVDETQRSANPAGAITQLVAQKLGATPGPATKAASDAKVLAEVQSAPLPDLAYALLQISDNVLADALGRQVAIATGGEPSFTGAAAAVKKVLGDHGFDVSQLQLFDTSGLSNQNKVPARLLSQVLAAAAGPDGKDEKTSKLRPLLAGLPVAGGSTGTLSNRYQAAPSADGKGWVRAKTGTLTSVNTLAGYVLDKDNRVLAFAFMSNGSDKDPGQAALDVLATTLRDCGCR